jgi:hypothetical protein
MVVVVVVVLVVVVVAVVVVVVVRNYTLCSAVTSSCSFAMVVMELR